MEPESPSLLVVDDDEDTCCNLADIFSDLGYRVETASSGPTAITKCQTHCFDLALLDLMMPEMDGLALFRILRQRCPRTVGVLITGVPQDPRTAECLKAGMKCVVPKPLNVAPLASLLAEIAG